MKYKVFGLAMAAVMLVCALSATAFEAKEGPYRVHQHMEANLPEETCTCGGTELCTHLPIIRIETGGQEIPGESITNDVGRTVDYKTTESGASEIVVTIETVEEDGVWHHASDPADQSAQALFRIRGNSSRLFPKKNYRIKLVSDQTATENLSLPLLGMSSDNDWALHGPFLDKTLLRNYMWMNLSAEIMGYAPNVRFCEVILDGEYIGVYLLMETIKESDDRVNLTDYDPDYTETSYLLRMDEVSNTEFVGEPDDDITLENYTWYTHRLEFTQTAKTGLQILYPKTETTTQDVVDYIQRDISEIERGLYSSDMLNGLYDYDKDLNVSSFVDYYIIQEFLANSDAFSRSTYFYRDLRGSLSVGPVWDYNNVLDNFFRPLSTEGFLLATRGWYGRLMTDEDFVYQVIHRYRELRKGILSDESLLQYIDDVIDYLGPAIQRNEAVWGYDVSDLSQGQYRIPDPGQTVDDVNPSSYEEAIERMEAYMVARGAWMDEHIEDLLQYCHPSKTASERVE